jgi:hypothetical protein
MQNFRNWLETFSDFQVVGQSQDWGDSRAANNRTNDERYKIRGVRSKYVANMRSEKIKKKK